MFVMFFNVVFSMFVCYSAAFCQLCFYNKDWIGLIVTVVIVLLYFFIGLLSKYDKLCAVSVESAECWVGERSSAVSRAMSKCPRGQLCSIELYQRHTATMESWSARV